MTERRKPLAQSYHLLGTALALVIGIFFTGLGIGILTNMVTFPGDNTQMIKIFGGLLIVYGIFRLLRVYLKYKADK